MKARHSISSVFTSENQQQQTIVTNQNPKNNNDKQENQWCMSIIKGKSSQKRTIKLINFCQNKNKTCYITSVAEKGYTIMDLMNIKIIKGYYEKFKVSLKFQIDSLKNIAYQNWQAHTHVNGKSTYFIIQKRNL